MKTYFLDSSALVKRYVNEVGSSWIQKITEPTHSNIILVARITWVEVLSAFARLQREEKIEQSEIIPKQIRFSKFRLLFLRQDRLHVRKLDPFGYTQAQ